MGTCNNNFSSRERKLIILLSAIALFVIGVLIIPTKDDSDNQRSEYIAQKTDVSGEGDGANPKFTLKPFDPNTIDSLSMADMGISKRKIKNLLNYRRAGAIFRNAEDLLRMYTWEQADVERLKPYIKIEKKYIQTKTFKGHKNKQQYKYKEKPAIANVQQHTDSSKVKTLFRGNKFKSHTIVDINTADSATLCSIPGIGKTIASIIIRKRQLLGGFYSTNQLLECKYVTEELLPWFKVDASTQLRKIHVNTDSFPDILRHPYVNKEQTKAIMKYRKIYGRFQNADALKNTYIFNDEQWEKINHYISFE